MSFEINVRPNHNALAFSDPSRTEDGNQHTVFDTPKSTSKDKKIDKSKFMPDLFLKNSDAQRMRSATSSDDLFIPSLPSLIDKREYEDQQRKRAATMGRSLVLEHNDSKILIRKNRRTIQQMSKLQSQFFIPYIPSDLPLDISEKANKDFSPFSFLESDKRELGVGETEYSRKKIHLLSKNQFLIIKRLYSLNTLQRAVSAPAIPVLRKTQSIKQIKSLKLTKASSVEASNTSSNSSSSNPIKLSLSKELESKDPYLKCTPAILDELFAEIDAKKKIEGIKNYLQNLNRQPLAYSRAFFKKIEADFRLASLDKNILSQTLDLALEILKHSLIFHNENYLISISRLSLGHFAIVEQYRQNYLYQELIDLIFAQKDKIEEKPVQKKNLFGLNLEKNTRVKKAKVNTLSTIDLIIHGHEWFVSTSELLQKIQKIYSLSKEDKQKCLILLNTMDKLVDYFGLDLCSSQSQALVNLSAFINELSSFSKESKQIIEKLPKTIWQLTKPSVSLLLTKRSDSQTELKEPLEILETSDKKSSRKSLSLNGLKNKKSEGSNPNESIVFDKLEVAVIKKDKTWDKHIENFAWDLKKQITKLFSQVSSKDFVIFIRDQKPQHAAEEVCKASNLEACTKHLDLLHFSTIKNILSKEDPETVKNWCEFYIQVAYFSYKIGDLFSAGAILSALENYSVSRLKKVVWEHVTDQHKALKNELQNLFSDTNNFKNYHTYLTNYEAKKKVEYSLVPLLDRYSVLLTHIHESNKDALIDGRLNPEKIKLIGLTLANFKKYRNALLNDLSDKNNRLSQPYTYDFHKKLIEIEINSIKVEMNKIYEKSLKLEASTRKKLT